MAFDLLINCFILWLLTPDFSSLNFLRNLQAQMKTLHRADEKI